MVNFDNKIFSDTIKDVKDIIEKWSEQSIIDPLDSYKTTNKENDLGVDQGCLAWGLEGFSWKS